ncbi:MAG: hypothetical protein JRI98_10270 [Deltaproteobacteria bacterium]|nr:hypothetical protein [Deltaproteobacteria bacterium]
MCARRRSTADVAIGLTIGHRHHAGHELERPKRLPKRARDVANPLQLELDRRLSARVHLGDLRKDQLLLDASAGRLQHDLGRRGLGGLIGRGLPDPQVHPHLRRHGVPIASRWRELGPRDPFDDDVAKRAPGIALLDHARPVRIDAHQHLNDTRFGHIDACGHLYSRKRLHPGRDEILRPDRSGPRAQSQSQAKPEAPTRSH